MYDFAGSGMYQSGVADSFSLVTDSMKKAYIKNMKNLSSEVEGTTGKIFKRWFGDWNKLGTAMKKADPYLKAVKSSFSAIASFGLDTAGVFLQIVDAMGILQPIVDIFTGLLQMIGGAALGSLAPALTEFANVLFSPEMIDIWTKLGNTIGSFIGGILTAISTLLSDPDFQKLLGKFIEILGNVFTVIMNIFGGIIKWLGTLNPSQLGALFYGLGVGIAFLTGILHGGPVGAILGASYAGIAAIALSPLLGLQHGGYIPPTPHGTLAILGEGGEGEYVTPESKMNLDNEKVVWAIEDNSRKIDMLIYQMAENNRLKRLKGL